MNNKTAEPSPTPLPFSMTRYLYAVISGAIGPLAFAPNYMWLLGMVSVMGLYATLKYSSPRQGAFIGWCFGLGFFGVGVSWVYVSIEVYGNASAMLAGFLTALFIMGLALFFALQCWLNQRFFNRSFYLFSFAALWVLIEWFRGWFLTGFPWLYLGYPHINSSFSGLAPIFGVLGISLVVAVSGAGFGEMFITWHQHNQRKAYAVARTYIPTGLFFLWVITGLSGKVSWVEPVEEAVLDVGLIQANIDQGQKFDADFIQHNLDLYDELSAPLWDADILVWPETAIPYIYESTSPVVSYFRSQANTSDTALVTGIFGRTEDGLHNSIASLGNGEGIYHKQKLVPFGEYVPFHSVFSPLLQIFDLPMSSLVEGPSSQEPLTAGSHTLSPFICYEVVYQDFVRKNARNADFLVTISNDTWFGASWGPLQHLEMAAMRALENGRYMIRATNNGVSAIINEKGQIMSRTEQFQAEVLRGDVQVFSGRTPFSYWGSYPALIICALLLILTRYYAIPALVFIDKIRNR